MNTLEKTHMINKIFQQESLSDFNNLAEKIGKVLEADIIIADTKNDIIGSDKKDLQGKKLPADYQEIIKANIPDVIGEDNFCYPVPLISKGNCIGSLFVEIPSQNESIEDMLLENLGVLISLIVFATTKLQTEQQENEASKIRASLATLSFSELMAASGLMQEFNKTQGIITTSKIADNLHLTRSVIVNALRKLQSAGLIESRSLGMKGTFIKITNPLFLQELKKEAEKINF